MIKRSIQEEDNNCKCHQTVKRLSTMRETWASSLGWKDPLETEMAIHSSTIAWKIPWTEKSGRLCPWGCKESDTTERLHSLTCAPNVGAPQYIGQALTGMRGEIDSNAIIVGDFNTPLSSMDKSSKQNQ